MKNQLKKSTYKYLILIFLSISTTSYILGADNKPHIPRSSKENLWRPPGSKEPKNSAFIESTISFMEKRDVPIAIVGVEIGIINSELWYWGIHWSGNIDHRWNLLEISDELYFQNWKWNSIGVFLEQSFRLSDESDDRVIFPLQLQWTRETNNEWIYHRDFIEIIPSIGLTIGLNPWLDFIVGAGWVFSMEIHPLLFGYSDDLDPKNFMGNIGLQIQLEW